MIPPTEEFLHAVELGTGRTIEEIRDTPFCATDEARELREQYYESNRPMRQHRVYVTRHCAEYREYVERNKDVRLSDDVLFYNIALYYTRHVKQMCNCAINKRTCVI